MKFWKSTTASVRKCKSLFNKSFGKDLPFQWGWTRSTAGGKITWIMHNASATDVVKIVSHNDKRSIWFEEKIFEIDK